MSKQDQLPAGSAGEPPGMPAAVPAAAGCLLFTASAQGAAHRGVALPNQDAVGSRGDPRLAGAEPLAVGEHAVGLARLTDRDVCLVVGAGPVGSEERRVGKECH